MRFLLIALPLLALAACQPQSSSETTSPLDPAAAPAARAAETAPPSAPDTAGRAAAAVAGAAPDTVGASGVVPGHSLGRLRLGAEAGPALASMGKPAFGDAAMQKAWATWYGPRPADGGAPTQLDVYTAPQNNDVDHHTVQLVRATAPQFRLANGLGVGAALADIQKEYPMPLPQATSYQLKDGRRFLYDDVAGGVAFELDGPTAGSHCRAVVVHLPGQAVASAALPMAEYLKQLK